MARGRMRVRLADEVAAELRQGILTGAYPPGARFRQEQLADEFDVSRTPIREAMRILEREALVVTDDRSGAARVVERDPESLIAAYELREVLDGLAARLATTVCSDGLAEQLTEALGEQDQILHQDWSPDAWTRANTRFHGLLVDAANNPYLQSLEPFLSMTSQVFRPMSVLGRDRALTAYDEHQQIADTVLAGDVEGAERLARAHIHTTSTALRRELHLVRRPLDPPATTTGSPATGDQPEGDEQ